MKKKFLLFINRRFAHVVGAAGDFTVSQHLAFLLKAEEKWADGKFADNLKPHVDSLVKQLNNQTARFEELDNKDKDNVVHLTWIKSCGIATTDLDRSEDICTITGTELESDADTYEMTLQQKISLSIDAEKIRVGTYELDEQVAHIMLRADKELSEWWNKQYLTALKASAGPNIPAIDGDGAPMTWDAGNSTTNIPEANYSVKIMANLVKQMQLNQVDAGFYINRGSLFEAWLDAGYDAGNAEGKGDSVRKSAVDMTFDMWNFSKAGITEDMFLVSNNAIAVKTYTRYTDTPVVVGGKINQTRYRMPSKVLPGVHYDVIYTLTCVDGHDLHTWQFMTKGGIFLNPEPCPTTINAVEYTPTGVYSFTKTA